MSNPFVNSDKTTSVAELFAQTIKKVSQRKTLLIAPNRLSYGSVIKEVELLLSLFADRGLKKGDSIIFSLENDTDMVVFFLAAFRYGLVTTTIDINATVHEAGQLFALAMPKAVVCSEDIHARWTQHNIFPEDIRLHVSVGPRKEQGSLLSRWFSGDKAKDSVTNIYPQIVQNLQPLTVPPEEPELTDPAVRAFTSGSTGVPKVVGLNYSAIIAQARVMAQQTEIEPNSVLLSLFQFTQLGALASGILLSFFSGSTLCRPVRKFANQHIPLLLDSIYKERVTHFYLVPTMMDLLLRYGTNLKEAFDTGDFKHFLCMAAMLPKSLWLEFESVTGKEVINSFGLTEANNLTYSGPNDQLRDVDSVGRCVGDSEAKIIDADGNEQAVGGKGELVIRSATMLKEYYGNPEATRQVLKDGWFYTGDLATMDNNGNIFIIGRIKDVIISGGYNIYPEEINLNLREHQGVAEAYTLGYNSETWGEQVLSCVVLKDDRIKEAELINFLRERLSELKVPKRIIIVQQLPMNARGKIDRQAVVSIISQHMQSQNIHSTADYRQQIFNIAADIFMIDAATLKTSSGYSDTPGWDSLGHMMLVAAVEKQFDCKIPPIEVLKIQTLGDLIELVGGGQVNQQADLEQSF